MKILDGDKQHSCGKGGCIVGYILPTETCYVTSYSTNIEYDLEKKFITIHALPIKGYLEEESATESITIETPNGQYTVRFNYSWNNEPIPSLEQLVMSISSSLTNLSNSQTTITAYYITPEGELQDVDSVTITNKSSELTVSDYTKNNYAYTYNVSTSLLYGTYTVTFKATKLGTKLLSASKKYTVNLGSQPIVDKIYTVVYKSGLTNLQGDFTVNSSVTGISKISKTSFRAAGTIGDITTDKVLIYISPMYTISAESNTYDYSSVDVSGTTITFNYTKRTPTTTYRFGYGGVDPRMSDGPTYNDIINNTTFENSSSLSWSKTWDTSNLTYSTLWFVYPTNCTSFTWKDSFNKDVSPTGTVQVTIDGSTYNCTYKAVQGTLKNTYTINIS